MIIRCIDIETTGMEPPEAAVCEIGWCDVAFDAGTAHVEAPHSLLVNPGKPIPAAASAVHHLTDADVAGAPTLADAMAQMAGPTPAAVCAHVAAFERKFIDATLPWICSYKVAVTVAPFAPEHKLQTLRYWSKLQVDPALASPPHRAGPDAYVCACLLARLLGKVTPDEMIRISGEPVVLPKFTFGKHAMIPLADVPSDYLAWIVGKGAEFDEDVLHTARHHLAERQSSGAAA